MRMIMIVDQDNGDGRMESIYHPVDWESKESLIAFLQAEVAKSLAAIPQYVKQNQEIQTKWPTTLDAVHNALITENMRLYELVFHNFSVGEYQYNTRMFMTDDYDMLVRKFNQPELLTIDEFFEP